MLLQRIAAPVLALLLLVTPAWGSEKPERIYIFALKAYQDGLYEVSADAFREYLASPGPGKQRAEAGLFLGQALLTLGRDEEGLAALEVAAKTDSKASVAPLARMIRAQRYLDLVRYGEAEAESGRWLRYFPRHPLRWEVRLLRGRALSGLKRWDEAAALFKEVAEAEKAPGELPVEALSRLAAVRTHQGKPEEAAAAWVALVERAPADPRAAKALLHLAARTEQAGRFDEALAHELLARGKRPNLLIGNNVLAHVPDLNGFVCGLKIVLAPAGVLTMEFPHLLVLTWIAIVSLRRITGL